MRGRHPDRRGDVDRNGVAIAYEVYGNGEPALLLIPASPTTHSRSWKGLVAHLAIHYRVVTMDGRGNGRSGRPATAEAHHRALNVADIVAVLDAAEVDAAVLVAHPRQLVGGGGRSGPSRPSARIGGDRPRCPVPGQAAATLGGGGSSLG